MTSVVGDDEKSVREQGLRICREERGTKKVRFDSSFLKSGVPGQSTVLFRVYLLSVNSRHISFADVP